MKEISHISDLTFNISSLVSNAPWHYAARAFLLNKSNHLALSHETGLYALVGGTMEIDETPQQCLLRELKEETGCDCQIQAPLGIITENRGLLDYRKKSFFYTASVLSAGIAKQTQEEKMLQQERHEQILARLNTEGKVKVKELANDFEVTEDCIRKDLTALEKEGLLKRIHGGSMLV